MVATNVALRDLNLEVPATDGRRIEVVANGLPMARRPEVSRCHHCQSSLHRPHAGGEAEPGRALKDALA